MYLGSSHNFDEFQAYLVIFLFDIKKKFTHTKQINLILVLIFFKY